MYFSETQISQGKEGRLTALWSLLHQPPSSLFTLFDDWRLWVAGDAGREVGENT